MRYPPIDVEAERARLAPLAAAGLSARGAALLLGLTKNTVLGRARACGIQFAARPTPGPGCNSDQARKGWATRRAQGWTRPEAVQLVRHVRRASNG